MKTKNLEVTPIPWEVCTFNEGLETERTEVMAWVERNGETVPVRIAEMVDDCDPELSKAEARLIVKAVNSHAGLLRVAKAWHGFNDELHRSAMPNCDDCKVIASAE